MHLASEQMPQQGGHNKKEPIIWKNTNRTWVRSGPGGTKCSQSYRKKKLIAPGCGLALVGQNAPHQRANATPRRPPQKQPIIWKNTKRTWVRISSGGTKCTLPASKCHTKAATTKRSQSYGKIQSAPGCGLALVGQNALCQRANATPRQPQQKGANHMENTKRGVDILTSSTEQLVNIIPKVFV